MKSIMLALTMIFSFAASAGQVTISEQQFVAAADLPAHVARTLSDEQKSELYIKGTITDEEGRRWNVWVLPGSEYALSWNSSSTEFAYDIMTLFAEKSFWKEEIFDKAVKGWVRAWQDGVVDMYQHGVEDLYRDYLSTWNYYSKRIFEIWNDGQLGWQASIIAEAGKLALGQVSNTLWAAGHVVYDALEGVGHATIGGVALPAGKVALVPVGAAGSLVLGNAVGGGLWLWNGAWYMVSKSSNVPTKESSWIFIENKWEIEQKKPQAEQKLR